MSPVFLLFIIGVYFIILLLISRLTSKHSDNQTFFLANRSSPWYLVAFGMIGASLSGITFISIPGWVGETQFSYLQIVLGYPVGYLVIATILMPMYYRLNLTSIYTYLDQRFGFWSYKTGAFYFLLSRVIGASCRLYLVAMVLQEFVLSAWGVPFWLTVLITIALIWVYTFKGGIKTVVWTDALQTLFMLLAVIISMYLIMDELDLSFSGIVRTISESDYSKTFFWDWKHPQFFVKSFLSGAFIAIVMSGLDQDMMQKNLSCKNIKEAQKNMFWFSLILVVVNVLFLSLGVLLYIYANTKGIAIPDNTDTLFPLLALKYFIPLAGVVFILGLTAAAYSSADSALTALTTSFCVDFLNFGKGKKENIRTRYMVHVGFSLLLLIAIIIFKSINNQAVFEVLFTIAGYTYGPLLGLYAFGLFMKLKPRDKLVPVICIASPVICYFLKEYASDIIKEYKIGFELILINGIITFIGLFLTSISHKKVAKIS